MNDKVIASKALTAMSGIGIIGMDYGITDKIKFRYWDSTNGYSKVITSQIRYDEDEPYFISNGNKYYINEFVKVNI